MINQIDTVCVVNYNIMSKIEELVLKNTTLTRVNYGEGIPNTETTRYCLCAFGISLVPHMGYL